ncbi:S66 peptidase family protein [Achromobacter ruhlandii]|uniref:Murein peptide carboxypeptidase n=1 Tax=Achromobacter ruhlandii TaxID=72557 RepID=A0ABM8LVA8_9BURK|nr:LD-carboxypeptidase [Achromobacter ruhlandii]AKP90477.1 Muramoyltetrapeptide carboxypeptidase [Achromobacter xylosoxidans]MCZ8432847.1 LD-carboxypeptidase [Achromobacter ruhlandii]MDC6089960.1 LD-carboxypeptidase [Achromobacter ruhlandii]MDC6152001.1 LD-carboxypeptidase [Achromobacter ruhlandii]MDD7979079.1 LD-carboxypeptidase [Achromobacter ruhlandii]
MAMPPRESVAPIDPTRRGLLRAAGALGLSSLALVGCAGRVAAPRDSQEAPGGNAAVAPRRDTAVPALRPGGRVAIVAPASAADGAAFDAAEWLQARGYDPRIMPAALTRADAPFDYLAGDDSARLNDLHAAFSDPAIDAVWCLQGGFGSWRLADRLDFNLLRQHPKPFIGYSDITALHLAIQRHAGFVTFHGPMLAQDLLAGKQEPTASHVLAMVGGQIGQGAWIDAPPDSNPVVLAPGSASGRLVGGNLALIAAMIGSRHEIATRDAILFIEDVNEALPRIDRLLWQLRAAGKFDRIRGVLAGNFTRLGLPMGDALGQSQLFALLQEQFGGRGIPVLAAWPSGHGDPNLTLPLGATVTLDTQRRGLRLEQAVAV